MPKQVDLRLHGISFEDAVKRLINTPPHQSARKAKHAKKAVRKSPPKK